MCPRTLVDRKRKRYDNAVDVVVRLHDPTDPSTDETLPRLQLDLEFVVRQRAERVQIAEVPYLRCKDRSDLEDVRLHQPRCHNASAYGLRGYVDNTLPLSLLCITMIDLACA